MRIPGGFLVLVIPVLAIIGFGVCLSWERSDAIDPVLTGSIR